MSFNPKFKNPVPEAPDDTAGRQRREPSSSLEDGAWTTSKMWSPELLVAIWWDKGLLSWGLSRVRRWRCFSFGDQAHAARPRRRGPEYGISHRRHHLTRFHPQNKLCPSHCYLPGLNPSQELTHGHPTQSAHKLQGNTSDPFPKGCPGLSIRQN